MKANSGILQSTFYIVLIILFLNPKLKGNSVFFKLPCKHFDFQQAFSECKEAKLRAYYEHLLVSLACVNFVTLLTGNYRILENADMN